MRKDLSKKINDIIIYLIRKLKKLDSVIVFMIIMGYFDFGIIQSIALIVYIVYKIVSSDNINFYNKVAFS